MNPYTGQDFIGFFATLLGRFFLFFTGQIGFNELATDEVQLVVLCSVAASSALVGTFLVLNKMTMLANSLSHTILIGIVAAYLIFRQGQIDAPLPLDALLLASLLSGWLTGYLTQFFHKTAKLSQDASIGLVFTTLFALGVVLVTLLTRNAHIGTEVVMGNVDALIPEDSKIVLSILAVNLLLFTLFFKEFKITSFDPEYASFLGISTGGIYLLLMTQTAATAIGAFRAVGVLMVLAFMTGPVLSARFFTHRLKPLLALASLFGVVSSVIGVAVSRHIYSLYAISLSTGGVVVLVVGAISLISAITHLTAERFLVYNKK